MMSHNFSGFLTISHPVSMGLWFTVQGGPSALGKNYVDTKFEVAFSCKFSLWPRPPTELWIWCQHISFPKQMGHPVHTCSVFPDLGWWVINSSQNLNRVSCHLYRVAHLLRERDMLTSDSKLRWWPGSEGKLTAKRNFKFGVNIIIYKSRWATLY